MRGVLQCPLGSPYHAVSLISCPDVDFSSQRGKSVINKKFIIIGMGVSIAIAAVWWFTGRALKPDWQRELDRIASGTPWKVRSGTRVPVDVQLDKVEVDRLYNKPELERKDIDRLLAMFDLGQRDVMTLPLGIDTPEKSRTEEQLNVYTSGNIRLSTVQTMIADRLRLGAPLPIELRQRYYKNMVWMAESQNDFLRMNAASQIMYASIFNDPTMRRIVEKGVDDEDPLTAAMSRRGVEIMASEVYMRKVEQLWKERGY
jgi:hypothetical protein